VIFTPIVKVFCILKSLFGMVLTASFKLDLIVIAVHITKQSPPGATFVPWPFCFSPLPLNRRALLLPPFALLLSIVYPAFCVVILPLKPIL
jgi:hypothetical protein